TWLASGAALLGCIHLTTFTLDWEPVGRAVLVGLLAHAAVATAAAVALRRLGRVFADPLRWSAQAAALLAMPLLIFPQAEYAVAWAACAAGFALVWIAGACVWRDRVAFPAFQVTLALAAVLLGVAVVYGR